MDRDRLLHSLVNAIREFDLETPTLLRGRKGNYIEVILTYSDEQSETYLVRVTTPKGKFEETFEGEEARQIKVSMDTKKADVQEAAYNYFTKFI